MAEADLRETTRKNCRKKTHKNLYNFPSYNGRTFNFCWSEICSINVISAICEVSINKYLLLAEFVIEMIRRTYAGNCHKLVTASKLINYIMMFFEDNARYLRNIMKYDEIKRYINK